MPRLPITDLSTDAIKAFLGLDAATPITIGDICDSDRVRGEYFDINYLTGIAGAAHAIYFGLSGDPVPPATIRECVRLDPHNPSNFRNYGYDVVGYSILAFSGEHNDRKILKYNNDEYWNDFYTAPARDIRCSIRAPDGLLWVGGQVTNFIYANERGLFSWNGSSWTRYTTPVITGQYVYAIELGTDPYMWIGTEHGFSILNRTTNLFTHYYIGAGTVPAGKMLSNIINCFAYNSIDESMWVGTANGLIHITDIADPSAWHLLSTTDGLAANNVKCLMVGPDSDCWAGFDGNGISRITESGGAYSFDNINTGSVPGLTTNHIRKIAIDPDTYYVWAATNRGIQYFHWNMACNDVNVLRVADGLPSDEVYTVRRDFNNRKWFGFDDHIGMLVDITDEIKIWGKWDISSELHIHDFLVDYEPVQVINEVVIGTQTWMSDNWRGNKRFMFPSGHKSKVYNYNEYNRESYGGLFTWDQVNDPNFCPSGWHVPSFAEWWEMITYLGGTTDAGNALKARSFGWLSHLPTVTNSTGFNATGSGYANNVGYYDMLEMTQFWTSDENDLDPTKGVSIGFYYDRQDAYIEAHDKSTYWFPVRLIKDIPAVAPVALPATNVTYEGFTANWEAYGGALTYFIDISTSPTFASFVPGYEDLEVGDVLFLDVTGLNDDTTYYYRVRANDGITTTPNSNRITTATEVIYTCCADFTPSFASHSADHEMFLSVGLVELGTGTIGDYHIEWRVGSTSGTIVYTSGITADPGEVQAQHPFVDEPVFAGTLYPVIKYIYVDGIKYTSTYEEGSRYSPDLIACLDPIIIDAIECSTVLNSDASYPYGLSYNNLIDLGSDKSRKLKFNLQPTTAYFAWAFSAYEIAEQVKLYYCTELDEEGVLIENYIHGSLRAGGLPIVTNLYPVNYPTDPKVCGYNIAGSSPNIAIITSLADFTYTAGDYIRIEITGSVYDNTITNTKWWIKFKCLAAEDLDLDGGSGGGDFIADSGISKIIDTPVISFVGDPTCMYYIEYNTLDAPFVALPGRLSGTSNLYRYSMGFYYWYGPTDGNPAGTSFGTPVRLGMRWYVQGTSYNIHTSTSFSTLINLSPLSETITVTKDTTSITFAFSDIDDYNKYKSDLDAMYADPDYATWLTLPDTDSRYYAQFRINTVKADSVGDNKTIYYWYFFWGCPITYDLGAKTITITFVVPTNNFADSTCNSLHEAIDNYISNWNSTKNYVIAGGSIVTHVRNIGTVYCIWVSNHNYFDQNKIFVLGIQIEEAYVPAGINMADYGFCLMTNTATSKIWVLLKYYDRVTFTDVTDHASRLANWRLERRISLRTDVCADTGWETVHEEP